MTKNNKQIRSLLLICITLAMVSDLAQAQRTPDSDPFCPQILSSWDGQQCKQCNTSKCLTCKQDFYDPDMCDQPIISESIWAQGCRKGCTTNNTQVCLECNVGYILDSGVCVPCPTNCEICNSKSSCTECANNYYQYNGNCIQVPDSSQDKYCIKYLSATQCKTCAESYYLEPNGKCAQCDNPGNCLYCDSTSSCQTCAPYEKSIKPIPDLNTLSVFLNAGKCEVCPQQNCQICSSTSVCNTCNEGYTLITKTNQCTQMQDCLKMNPETSDCLECQDGFFLTATSPKICNECLRTNGFWRCGGTSGQIVLQCDYNIGVSSQYATVDDGAGQKKCINIAGNKFLYCLQVAADLTKCEQCYQDADIFMSNGFCYKGCDNNPTIFGEGCLTCVQGTTTTAATCSVCKQGHILKSGQTKCAKCIISNNPIQSISCQTCNDSNGCIQCKIGFYNELPASGTTSNTVVCQPCKDNNCEVCDPQTKGDVCLTCAIGYYLSYSSAKDDPLNQGTTCIKCDSAPNQSNIATIDGNWYMYSSNPNQGCWTCSHERTCTQCQPGYYLNPDTQQCISVGVIKSDGLVAQSCRNKYQLSGSVCKLCYLDYASQCPKTCSQAENNGNGTNTGQNSSLLSAVMVISMFIGLLLL